jgi:predicted Rossmann-fold nucleotide-binding protein
MGTLEELTEAITLKQLGLWHGQIILLNTKGYYDNLSRFFETMVNENFIRHEHKTIWSVADTPEETMSLLEKSDPKDKEWRKIARI